MIFSRLPRFLFFLFSRVNFSLVGAYLDPTGPRVNPHAIKSSWGSRPELGQGLHFVHSSTPHNHLAHDVLKRYVPDNNDDDENSELLRRSTGNKRGRPFIRHTGPTDEEVIRHKIAERKQESRKVQNRYKKQVQAMHKLDPRSSPEQAREIDSMAATAPQLRIPDTGRTADAGEVQRLRAVGRTVEAERLETTNRHLHQAQDRWNNLLQIIIDCHAEFRRSGNWRWEYRPPISQVHAS